MYSEPSASSLLVLAGNSLGLPEDMPLRSGDYLKSADLVVFESDRGARTALKHAGIHRPYDVLSEHREAATLGAVEAGFAAGKVVLYMSDQGVPTLADPGKELLKLALARGVKIKVIPGPSSITVALSAWPHRLERFQYVGFPPADRQNRVAFLEKLAEEELPMVILDTPYRLDALLADCQKAFGGKRAGMLAMDISGSNESFLYGTLVKLTEQVNTLRTNTDPPEAKLNFVLVVDGIAGGHSRSSKGMVRVKGSRGFVKR